MNETAPTGIAPRHSNLSRRLAKHFAALALPAVLIPAAQAQVIWSGPVNLNLPSNIDGIYLNVVTGVTGSTGGSVAGWDVNPYGSATLSFFSPTPAASSGYVANLGDNTGRVDNLPYGTAIGPGSVFSTGALPGETTGATAFTLNSVENLVGFRFQNELNGNQVHYGWMRFSLSSGAATQPRSIVEYAYESTAGAEIFAGVVPEPASASLLLLGLGGLFGLRGWSRRQ